MPLFRIFLEPCAAMTNSTSGGNMYGEGTELINILPTSGDYY